MKKDKSGRTLADWRGIIETKVPHVGVKPYSHNLITLALGAIGKNWGRLEANKAITDFGLDDLGWQKKRIN